jgi:hypothetical protein
VISSLCIAKFFNKLDVKKVIESFVGVAVFVLMYLYGYVDEVFKQTKTDKYI